MHEPVKMAKLASMYYDHIALITTSDDVVFHREKTRHIAKNIGVRPEDIAIYRFGRHPEGSMIGCITSHLSVWEHIASHRYEKTLILEDDVVFLRPVQPSDFDDFLQRHPEWEVFYLGHRPIIWAPRMVRQTPDRGIVEVRTNDTHAYIIRHETAKKLFQIGFQRENVDIFLRQNTRHSYALFPMRAIQNGNLLTNSYFNGMSERNSQYIRYAIQEPLNPFRALFWFVFLLAAQPWVFLSSTWMAITNRHPS